MVGEEEEERRGAPRLLTADFLGALRSLKLRMGVLVLSLRLRSQATDAATAFTADTALPMYPFPSSECVPPSASITASATLKTQSLQSGRSTWSAPVLSN